MESKHRSVISWIILGIMIFLRIPFRGGLVNFGLQDVAVVVIFDITTYFLTALFIILNITRSADFNIDRLALLLIIAGKPILTLVLRGSGPVSPFTFPGLPSLVEWVISAGLLSFVIAKRKDLAPVRVKDCLWLGIGLGAGLLTSLILAYPTSLQIPSEDVFHLPSVGAMLGRLPSELFFQLGYAAVIEEPLFRGFLWGLLRQARLREVWIWLIQAAMFVIGHFYYISRGLPVSMWVLVPFGALMLGFLAWRSRSIAPSILAHAAGNATGLMAGYFYELIRLGLFRW